ncbi:MAG: putative toxin-antitoxin system toxin component, PIN family [Acidovorax sp.]|uniref:putative toxin-antitoxin system toxin component, PIN family n=1 Tax=Acidovorax sp. TaxID=1872122 RepID=UPI0039E3D373
MTPKYGPKSTPTAVKSMQRLVADTNTIISGLLWSGAPRQIINSTHAMFFSSPALLEELAGVLRRAKFAHLLSTRNVRPNELFDSFAKQCHLVYPHPIAPTCRDPDDDAVLACALTAGADCIVSGDKDLLVLGHYQRIPIVTAAQALAAINSGLQYAAPPRQPTARR